MQLNLKYATSENLDFFSKFPISNPMVPAASILDVYSIQHLPLKSKMEKMYSMNNTLNMKNNMSGPKKENMFHSVFNTVNQIWERFSKVPASFMTGINHSLSVTVVHNDGIIQHEFFKDLTTKRDTSNSDNVYIQGAQRKESLNVVEYIHSDIFNEKKPYTGRISNENIKENLNYSYKCTDIKSNYIEIPDKKESLIKENGKCNLIDYDYLIPIEGSNEMLVDACLYKNTRKLLVANDIDNCENTCNESTSEKNQVSTYIDNSTIDQTVTNKEFSLSTLDSNLESVQENKQTTVSNMLTNMWQKVCNSVSDRFYRTDLIESDNSMKQSLSPKQRRKLNTIAMGRGRGRARSQLRRSGVSQTRHRKERSKHDLEIDIESDFKSWQDFEVYCTVESKESEDCFRLDKDTMDAVGINSHKTYTFADVKPKIQKSKTRKISDQGICKLSGRMRRIPEYTEETKPFHTDCIDNRYNSQKNSFRPRLMSESSIDSEDSYCIVFETGSEVNYRSDLEDSDESDMDQTSEDEDMCKDEDSSSSTSMVPVQKVTFNLKPVVHTMIQWNYAYRAARRGPWEQMARDRERFKDRIHCIERVLNPILSVQHRTHIWQERFASTE
ncbi:uncharacterized protein LOC128884799 [Hylaeus volcanicus]|uniref:uncharacterized protein LOC128884799 n=1 Tax=Hylaeus volcanicus TaxID=313075 RepID=UPI0023B8055E|nr:uncharacterized protein LOC128884799 [Hylaeus volcanicus]